MIFQLLFFVLVFMVKEFYLDIANSKHDHEINEELKVLVNTINYLNFLI